MLLKNKSQLFFIAILVLVLVLVAWFTYNIYIKNNGLNSDSSAYVALSDPSGTTYTDINGNPVDLSSYLDKVLVVNSWASWSPSSATDLQTLSDISQNYSSSEVVFLAINRGEPKERASAFLKINNINTDVMLVLDKNDVFYDSIDGFSMPETVIYNQSGDVLQHQRGNLDEFKLKSIIDSLVKS
jgi:thiol-disulfide isomerase/thioredoxin